MTLKLRCSNKCKILILLSFFWIFGCSVLTSTQMNEVKKFAVISEKYTTLPESLFLSYATLKRNYDLLVLSRREFGGMNDQGNIDTSAAKKAWKDFNDIYQRETEITKAGKRMDKAIKVLDIYTKIMKNLVSDEFSNAISKSTEKLCKSIDEAIDNYNGTVDEDETIDNVGGDLALIIRSTTGVFIRYKQTSILREVVKDADPMIANLMATMEDLAINSFKPAFENYEKNDLGKGFRAVANSNKQLDVLTMEFIYENLVHVRISVDLANNIASASRSYKAAHNKLVEKTRNKMDLELFIEEIKVFQSEIEAAQKIERNVNK
ncbi:hypothetical protein ACFL2E_11995 [Thermodesulfobacteriota bacterium]